MRSGGSALGIPYYETNRGSRQAGGNSSRDSGGNSSRDPGGNSSGETGGNSSRRPAPCAYRRLATAWRNVVLRWFTRRKELRMALPPRDHRISREAAAEFPRRYRQGAGENAQK